MSGGANHTQPLIDLAVVNIEDLLRRKSAPVKGFETTTDDNTERVALLRRNSRG